MISLNNYHEVTLKDLEFAANHNAIKRKALITSTEKHIKSHKKNFVPKGLKLTNGEINKIKRVDSENLGRAMVKDPFQMIVMSPMLAAINDCVYEENVDDFFKKMSEKLKKHAEEFEEQFGPYRRDNSKSKGENFAKLMQQMNFLLDLMTKNHWAGDLEEQSRNGV